MNRQDEASRFINSGGKLDTFHDEEIEMAVISPKVDKNGKISLEKKTKKTIQKVIYTQGITEKLSCRDSDHFFVMLDKHRYIAKCIHCTLHRKIYPVTHNIVDGKIVEV
jgi:hypothetical protein